MITRVENEHRRRHAAKRRQLARDCQRKVHTASRDADEHDGVESAMAFDDLVRETQEDALQAGGIEQLRTVVEMLRELAHGFAFT